MAYQVLLNAGKTHPDRLIALMQTISDAVGVPDGIVAGQAWECEEATPLEEYRRQKTGALFIAATVGGALSAGADPTPWRVLGETLGEAYQIADDIRDALGTDDELGKPAGRDADLGRPTAITELGIQGAVKHFEALIARAAASIPECPGAEFLRELVDLEAQRLLPAALLQRAV
jgi:geranylgeranyl diphosphate synthase type II